METITLQNLKPHSLKRREALRVLKTNLQFCGDDIKSILITSTIPGECKSTISVDLAVSLTESGKRVLLIDADMRKSVLVGRLQATAEDKREIFGLSHYLSGQKKLDDVIYSTQLSKLFMIFSGPYVPNPTEILDKKYFAELMSFARNLFDYVIVDCPPIGATIDAAVIAKYCDGAIFVVAQGVAGSKLVVGAKQQLETSGVRILGAVMSGV